MREKQTIIVTLFCSRSSKSAVSNSAPGTESAVRNGTIEVKRLSRGGLILGNTKAAHLISEDMHSAVKKKCLHLRHRNHAPDPVDSVRL